MYHIAKIDLLAVFVTCILLVFNSEKAFSQNQPYIHAGIVATTINGSGAGANFNKFGILAGVGLEMELSNEFYFALEANFAQKGDRTSLQQSGPNIDQGIIDLYYLQVPGMLGYKLDDHFSFFLGPAIGVLISEQGGNLFGPTQAEWDVRTFELSAAGGVRYSFSDHFGSMLRFEHSILSILNTGLPNNSIQGARRYNAIAGLSLYYSF